MTIPAQAEDNTCSWGRRFAVLTIAQMRDGQISMYAQKLSDTKKSDFICRCTGHWLFIILEWLFCLAPLVLPVDSFPLPSASKFTLDVFDVLNVLSVLLLYNAGINAGLATRCPILVFVVWHLCAKELLVVLRAVSSLFSGGSLTPESLFLVSSCWCRLQIAPLFCSTSY